MIKTIHLKKRPEGKPTLEDFDLVEEDEKLNLNNNQVLLQTEFISVDPYLRGRMRDAKSYIEPFELGKPIVSSIVAKVVESKHENFNEGEFVFAQLPWKNLQVAEGHTLKKVDKDAAPLSAYLGILGMTGLTAYFGLLDIGKPKPGETLVVSGAAGAVGTVVGQIGKIMGLTVI